MRRTSSALVSTLAVTGPVLVPLLIRRRRLLRGVALVATAATAGISMGHALEMPAKRSMSPAEWWWLASRLYRPWFGRAGHVEGVAWLALPALAAVSSTSRRAAGVASGLLVAANPIVFVIFVAPTNRATLTSPDHPRWDVERLRNSWEFGHLARFVCHALAFVVLASDTAQHVREQ